MKKSKEDLPQYFQKYLSKLKKLEKPQDIKDWIICTKAKRTSIELLTEPKAKALPKLAIESLDNNK